VTTGVEIAFGIYAPIKQDGTPSTTDNISFSDVDDLQDNLSNRYPIITLEPDYWLLDGTYKFVDAADTHVGFFNDTQSDADGLYGSPYPTLTIDFSEDHDLDGITLRFSGYTGDWCKAFNIAFYDSGAGLITSLGVAALASARYSYSGSIVDVRQVVIQFYETNKAYRWVRLKSIDYGSNFFEGDEIKNAKLIERIDPLSISLPENVLEFSIHSDDGVFSPVNPDGDWDTLQEGMPVEVYEILNGSYIYLGLFYLEDWKSVTDYETDFEAGNAISILNSVPFGGMFMSTYTGSPGNRDIEDVLDDLFGLTDLEYEIDASLTGIDLIGYIPAGTMKEALQLICFTIGGYVDCSRTNTVFIKPLLLASDVVTADYELTFAEQGSGRPLKVATLVTGVEIISHEFVPSGSVGNPQLETLIKDTYTNGAYDVFVDFPAFGIQDGGATTGTATYLYEFGGALLFNTGNLTFTVTAPGVIDTTTMRGVSIKTIYSEYASGLPSGAKQNTVKINDAFLTNSDNAAAMVARVYDYYAQRFQPQLRLFSPFVRVGDSVAIEMSYSQTINAIVEKMTTDLTGGFIADVEVRGVLA